jgi:hypothetical protein
MLKPGRSLNDRAWSKEAESVIGGAVNLFDTGKNQAEIQRFSWLILFTLILEK